MLKIEKDAAEYEKLIAELQLIHHKLLQAPKQFLLVCEEHQSDRLVEEVQEVWDKLTVAESPAALTQVPVRSFNARSGMVDSSQCAILCGSVSCGGSVAS